jgi:YggT family protein
MIGEAIRFVLEAIFSLFILSALVRFWMQAFRAPTRNPMAQFSIALTDWAVKPLRRVIPGLLNLDWSSLIVAGLLEFVLQVLIILVMGVSLIENPNVLSVLLFLAFVKLVRLSIYIFMGALIIQVVLSWVNPYNPFTPFFVALTDPFLKPVRRVIPPVGGIDISPLFIFIFFQLLLMLPVTWLEMESARMAQRAVL